LGKLSRYLGLGLRYPLQLLSGLLLTLFIGLLLGLNPSIQDFAGDRAADILGRYLRTEVSIDRIQLRTHGELELAGFYLEDHHGDTLIFAENMRIRLRLRPLLQGKFNISRLYLDGLYLRLIKKDYEQAFNFDFLLPDATESPEIDSVLRLPYLTIENFGIQNSRLVLHDYTKAQQSRQFSPNHLEIEQLQFQFEDLILGEDSSTLQVKGLQFREKAGIQVKTLQFGLARLPDRLRFDSLEFATQASLVRGQLQFNYGQERDLLAFAQKVRLQLKLEQMEVDPDELAYFTGLQELPRERVYLSGQISGRLAQLRSRNIRLRIGRDNYLQGQFNITGLPDAATALYDLKISDAYLSRRGLEEALPLLSIPAELTAIDYLQLSADCFGYPNDFVAHGLFSSNAGEVVTDLNLKLQGENSRFSGEINADRLNLQKLLNQEKLGEASFQVSASGQGNTLKALSSQLAGQIRYVDYNGYRYEQLEVNGYLDYGTFTGRINAADSNANFSFFGVAEVLTPQPFYNFVADINRINLHALNFSSDTVVMQGFMELCLEGLDQDSAQGEINLRQLEFDLNSRHLSLSSIDIQAISSSDSNRLIRVQAPFGEASLAGNYSFRNLGKSLEQYFNHYLQQEKVDKREAKNQNFHLKIALHDAQPVADFLFPGRYTLDSLEGYMVYQSANFQSDIYLSIPQFRADSLRLSQLSLIGRSDLQEFNLDLYADSLFRNSRFVAHKLSAEQTLGSDSVKFEIRATGDSSYNKIAISGQLGIEGDSILLGFKPSYIDLYGNRWLLEQQGPIWIADSMADIHYFALRQAKQEISLNGRISSRRSDSLYLNMVDVDLQQLNPILAAYESSLEGYANMSLRTSSVLRKAAVFGNVEVDGLVLDGQPLGDLLLRSDYSTELNRADLFATLVNLSDTLATVSGNLASLDGEQDIDLDIQLNRSPIYALERVLKPAFDDLSGMATARLRLFGKLHAPELTGYADLEKARLRVDFLNQYYNIDKRIRFTETSIDFDQALIYDDAGGSGRLGGAIRHEKFRRTRIDLRLDANNLLVLNTPPSYTDDYFGSGKLTGYATFVGPIDLVDINIVATTDRGTNISIPLDAETNRGAADFITFINKKADTLVVAEQQNFELSGVSLSMNLTVTPEAEINLLLDRQTGDIIRGRGNAVIELQINPQGELRMFGNYTFASGDYTFTLANIANKKFRITEGSTIRWSGDPYDAQLNLNAVYRQRASVMPLLSQAAQTVNNATTNRNANQYMNIDAYLKLSGSLLNPNIGFQLKIPSINENDPNDPYAATIRNINNDEQRLNNQVIALLVAGQFIPEGDVAAGGFAANSGLNSVSEVLFNQFSNLLSPLTGNVNIGLNYRNTNFANQLVGNAPPNESLGDLNVAVNTSLFDNRVLIDGNIGNNTNYRNANQSLGGEVTVEYLVNADGSFRLKAFNRLDDRVLFNSDNNYRQGVGLSYTKNYNTTEELKNDAIIWLQDRFVRRIPWAPDRWKGDF
jgi:hypothetical protein